MLFYRPALSRWLENSTAIHVAEFPRGCLRREILMSRLMVVPVNYVGSSQWPFQLTHLENSYIHIEKDPEGWDSYSQAISLVMLGSSSPLFWFHDPSFPPPLPPPLSNNNEKKTVCFPSSHLSHSETWSQHTTKIMSPSLRLPPFCAKMKRNYFEKENQDRVRQGLSSFQC